MKTGLIMEGGAMRGMFTAGVLDVFMLNGIKFDGAIGVSAGAAFGCNIKSVQPGRALRYNINFAHEKRYCSVLSWLLTGDLYGGHYCYHVLPEKLDVWDQKTFEENPMEFWCVATDMNTAEPLYHKCTDGGKEDLLWIQGSASMPIASRPLKCDGHLISDGGTADSVPYRFFQSQGYDRNVVILTQPADYRKVQYGKKMLAFLKTALHSYPALYEKLAERWYVYNDEIADIVKEEQAGNVYVIRPQEALNIGSTCHDAGEMRRVYNLGVEQGKKHLQEVREWLQEK